MSTQHEQLEQLIQERFMIQNLSSNDWDIDYDGKNRDEIISGSGSQKLPLPKESLVEALTSRVLMT
jgi:hypothetical protein